MENILEEVQGKESRETIDKRKLLALAATAAAGLAITPLIKGAHADGDQGASGSGQALIVGKSNQATYGDQTVLNTNTTEESIAGFRVHNDGNTENAQAIAGEAPNGVGVLGISSAANGAGVEGHSKHGTGVFAESECGVALQVVGKSGIQGKVDGGAQDGAAILRVDNNGEPGTPATPGQLIGWPVSIAATCPKGIGILAFGPQFGVYGTTDPGGPEGNPGIGVFGMSGPGTGVRGQSGSGTGVFAASGTGTALAVVGKSTISCNTNTMTEPALMVENSGLGISATSTSNFGLESCSPVFSVIGLAINPKTTRPSQDLIDWALTNPNRGSVGLLGYTIDGKGVVGFADTGIGVLAISKGSSALRVEGKSSFSSVGSDVIPAKKLTYNVYNDLVTANSHVNITLLGDTGILVRMWVTRSAGVFTIHLSDKIKQDVPFSYFIVEP